MEGRNGIGIVRNKVHRKWREGCERDWRKGIVNRFGEKVLNRVVEKDRKRDYIEGRE